MLSAGLVTFTHIIKLFAIPQTVKENLCAALVNSVIDCKLQNWEEMTAPAFDALNHIGPLRKNQHSTLDDINTIDICPFEFDRFKRHLQGILERLCRLAASDNNRTSTNIMDDSLEKVISTNDTVEEEEDNVAAATTEDIDPHPHGMEEESDWVCDVKRTMDLLPRL